MVSKPIFRSGLNLKIAQATFCAALMAKDTVSHLSQKNIFIQDIGGMTIFPILIYCLKPSWNAEIGLKQGFKINNFTGTIDAALFWQEYSNTIEITYGTWDQNAKIYLEMIVYQPDLNI